jgi:hypothetical protein
LLIRENDQRIALASSGKKDEVKEYKRIAQITDLVDVETSADDAEWRNYPLSCPQMSLW